MSKYFKKSNRKQLGKFAYKLARNSPQPSSTKKGYRSRIALLIHVARLASHSNTAKDQS